MSTLREMREAKNKNSAASRRQGSAMQRPGRGAPPKKKNVMQDARSKRDINRKMKAGREQHASRTHI